MCELNDEEALKYTCRDFGAWAASAGLLTALPGAANAVAVAERNVTITTTDGSCDGCRQQLAIVAHAYASGG